MTILVVHKSLCYLYSFESSLQKR